MTEGQGNYPSCITYTLLGQSFPADMLVLCAEADAKKKSYLADPLSRQDPLNKSSKMVENRELTIYFKDTSYNIQMVS